MEKLTQEIKERKDAICSLSYNVPYYHLGDLTPFTVKETSRADEDDGSLLLANSFADNSLLSFQPSKDSDSSSKALIFPSMLPIESLFHNLIDSFKAFIVFTIFPSPDV
ncbi:hypothetical protein NC652_036142 [Populus alba x Populus x berolinensis]|nr:hypothetical protein NC652_036142 [Populus alba x Populus x berolinensis]